MTVPIPEKLKSADLTRFIVRAQQLETVKPVIAYWCEYWIVNQILSKGLHEDDQATLVYTTTLMDKLEQIKAENATNDAIVDDAAGRAYCEQFGLETFFRADRAVNANKVTKQTADTFQAAATFLELVNIWAAPDAETQAKIKYAKWNAVRIVKALKEGKDPNESNPKPPPVAEENLPPLDPNDPEVQELDGHTKPQPAYVEDVPDEEDKIESQLARQSSIDQSLHPSNQVSANTSPRSAPAPAPAFDPYPRDSFPYSAVQKDDVSPMDAPVDARTGSVGGGYFPEVPTFTSEPRDSTTLPTTLPSNDLLGLPQQPSGQPHSPNAPPDFQLFPSPNTTSDTLSPQDFYQTSQPALPPPTQYAPSSVQPQQPSYPVPPPQPSSQPPLQQSIYHPPVLQPSFSPPPTQPTYQLPPQQYTSQPAAPQQFNPPTSSAPRPMTNQQLNTDDVAIAKAQKHAKWAISALNFEDAATAVRELREALKTLGAQ